MKSKLLTMVMALALAGTAMMPAATAAGDEDEDSLPFLVAEVEECEGLPIVDYLLCVAERAAYELYLWLQDVYRILVDLVWNIYEEIYNFLCATWPPLCPFLPPPGHGDVTGLIGIAEW